MSEVKRLNTPLSDEDVKSLKAGDTVAISGFVYTARDMAHKRLCELIDAGKKLLVGGKIDELKARISDLEEDSYD